VAFIKGRAGKPMRTLANASGRIGIRDVGKRKAPARGVLRAQIFDDQGMSQGGQLCQTKNAPGFNGFAAGGFRWLASGAVASAKWIPWLPQKNPARHDRDSASL
jgi:hypothetical protein